MSTNAAAMGTKNFELVTVYRIYRARGASIDKVMPSHAVIGIVTHAEDITISHP